MPKDCEIQSLRERHLSQTALAARAIKLGDPGLARCYHRSNMVTLISARKADNMNERAKLFNRDVEKILKTRLGLLELQMNNDTGPKQRSCFRAKTLYLMIRHGFFKHDQTAGSYFQASRGRKDRLYKRFLSDYKIGKRMRTLKFSAELSSVLCLLDLIVH